MNRRGFTIVEVLIVIFIMGVLLVLGVVNLRTSEINSRDAERKTDIETISIYLNTFYTTGNGTSTNIGRYPSTLLTSSGLAFMTQTLRDIDNGSLKAPGVTDATLTFISATNNTQTAAGILPQPTISQYVYQPLQSDGSLCISELQECRKFNLYYKSEIDSVVHMITGKNQ